MKFDTTKLSLAAAVTTGILYVVCAVVVAIAPRFALALFGNLLHMVNLGSVMTVKLSFGGFLIGLVQIFIYSYVAFWIFGSTYNRLVSGRSA
ncbi:MAG: hypothetical protein HY459_04135 [Parcubacteria group bacterium]|nr:hypothetical protein [Parcubacteria group bacterium]